MVFEKDSITAKCICLNCVPTISYTKEEWLKSNHFCPKCDTAIDIKPDSNGDEFQIELVDATDLKVGEYIFCTSHYCKIVSIGECKNKDNHLYICVLNYRGCSYAKNEKLWRITL